MSAVFFISDISYSQSLNHPVCHYSTIWVDTYLKIFVAVSPEKMLQFHHVVFAQMGRIIFNSRTYLIFLKECDFILILWVKKLLAFCQKKRWRKNSWNHTWVKLLKCDFRRDSTSMCILLALARDILRSLLRTFMISVQIIKSERKCYPVCALWAFVFE